MLSNNLQKNKKSVQVYRYIVVAMVVTTIPFNIWLLFNGEFNHLTHLNILLTTLASLLGCAYMLAGNSKKVAGYYKNFTILHACTILLGTVATVSIDAPEQFKLIPIVTNLAYVIAFAATFTLAFVKDLGRTQSINMAKIVMGINLVMVVGVMFAKGAIIFDGDMLATMGKIRTTAIAANSICLYLATLSKYADKFEREINDLF